MDELNEKCSKLIDERKGLFKHVSKDCKTVEDVE